jgi:catechol 2,3-dioxygenase-like lactoylglutathione lyase family enzyme
MSVCQVALSTLGLERAIAWYQRVLGLKRAGERRHREGHEYAQVVGFEDISFDVACLVGDAAFFQLEVFEFFVPRPSPVRVDWHPHDIGYSMIRFRAADFDDTLVRARELDTPIIGASTDERGSRRAWLRDPDGVLLELIECKDPPRVSDSREPLAGAAPIQSVVISVSDLGAARRFWVETLGLPELAADAPHRDRAEGPWSPRGPQLLVDGGSIVVEVVQCGEPRGRPRPAGYRISDQGILNVALGTTDPRDFEAVHRRLTTAGYASKSRPFVLPGVATVAYFGEHDASSLELLHVEPRALERMGFPPLPTASRIDAASARNRT